MFRRGRHLAVALVLLCAGSLPMAWAARETQSRVRKVKACVGIIPTMGEPAAATAQPSNPFSGPGVQPDPDAISTTRSPNPNPYIFYFLDQRKDLKPDGWEFVNPVAPAFVTVQQAARWGGSIAVGRPLKPDMAAYWEVVISPANFNRLAEMDVIYLPIARSSGSQPAVTNFTENQRRILMRLADAGVTIWVDWGLQTATMNNVLGGAEGTAAPTDRRKNGFFTNLDFMQTGGTAATPVVTHPLLDSIYPIKTEGPLVGSAIGNQPPSLGRAVETRAADTQMTANFVAVVRHASINPEQGAYIAAARYGAGYIVATAGNVGRAIAGTVAGPTIASPDLGQAEAEDLKFAYNVIGWRSEVTAQQKNGRHTAQSGVQLNGLIEQTSYPSMLRPAGPGQPWIPYPPASVPANNLPINPVSPLIVNGVVIAYTQWMGPGGPQSELVALDADPNSDFDGLGYVDDGLAGGSPINANTPSTNQDVDFSIGLGGDRIMGGSLPKLFGMTVGEVPDPGNAANDQGARAHVFAAGESVGSFAGLYSLPAPRPGLAPGDYWSNPGVVQDAPNVGIDYKGAPGFANLPGISYNTGVGTPQIAPPLSYIYAGGVQGTGALFGAGQQGKLVSFAVAPNGDMGRWVPNAVGGAPTFDNTAPEWYYPPNQEPNRLGILSGPVVTAQVQDLGSGAIDTIVLTTSVSSGDPGQAQVGNQGGDTTGKVEGFIVATKGDLLTFPQGNNQPGANNPNAGRRFVCARWLNVPPGTGQVPQPREITWDPTKHFEVRVMDKDMNYVLARFVPGMQGFTLLPNGTGGQVELPSPQSAPGLNNFAAPGNPGQWDLNRFVLLADYSPLPLDVDNGGKTIRPRFSPATPYVRDTQQVVIPTGVAGGVSVGQDNLIYYGTGQGYMCAAEWRRGRAGFRWKMRSAFNDSLAPNTLDTVGTSPEVDPTNPGYLNDYVFTAAPAAGERVVFAAAGRGGGQGTVYVIEPDFTPTFKLQSSTLPNGQPLPPPGLAPITEAVAKDVMLMADHGLGIQPTSPFILADQQPWGRIPNQFEVDAGTGTVTFLNMENFALDLTNVRSPAQMLALGIDTGNKPAVPIQWAVRGAGAGSGLPTLQNPWVAWIPIPIVSVYRTNTPAPERWLSGPVISGDRVYLMGTSGTLHEIPLDPKAEDATFPRLRDSMGNPVAGLNGFDVGNTNLYGAGIRKIRNVSYIPGRTAYYPSPAVSQGLLAASSLRGTTLFTSPSIVVADANRVVEASGDSKALANTDSLLKHRFASNDFPLPTDPQFAMLPAGVNIVTERKLLSRTATVKKLDQKSSLTSMFLSTGPTFPESQGPAIKESSDLAEESYLAADTGNNRAVEFNAAGKVVWECTQFQDPFGILPPGEPLTLNGPMDVQRWIELEQVQGGVVFVVHTLIVDTGNTRVLEIVDKVVPQRGAFNERSYAVGLPGQVDQQGNPVRWYHALVWSSQTNAQGLKLKYRTAQRIYWQQGDGNLIPTGATPPAGTIAVPAESTFPYLPPERYLSYTMASVTGQQIYYPDQPAQRVDYNQYFAGTPSQTLQDRKPLVRPGGDSLVFLRGRWKREAPGAPTPALLREPRVDKTGANVNDPDSYRFGQGIIDPNVPICDGIYDEMVGSGSQEASQNPVHRLNGVQSVQRTVRADVKFAPYDYGSNVMPRRMYFLIADTDGVWEFQMLPGQLVPPAAPPQQARQFRLTMAFTNEDYAYVTGAGNGNPANIYSASDADHAPGGRLLSAVSARRLPNGAILVTSRTPANQQPLVNVDPMNPMNNLRHHLHVGADVFLLRSEHYLTALDRQAAGAPVPYQRPNVLTHGWKPDAWVQNVYTANIPTALNGPPSIRWRAAEQLDLSRPPTLRTQLQAGTNPNELTGTYVPVQPNYADVVY